MNPKALIDLHCDTLTDCRPTPAGNPDTLDDPERVLSLSAMPEDVHWAQFYAVFIPDEYRGQAAIEYFEQNRENFFRQMKKFSQRAAPCRTYADMERAWAGNQTAAFLTIENGSALAGDLSRIRAYVYRPGRDTFDQITLSIWCGTARMRSARATPRTTGCPPSEKR